jgi:hypothetical protein
MDGQEPIDEESLSLRERLSRSTTITRRSPILTPTEQSTGDRLMPIRQLDNIHYRLFPSGTRIVGPVVVIQRARQGDRYSKATVMVSYKLLFPDGCQVVYACETRSLWAGVGEAAFDVPADSKWKVAAAQRGGIIINQGGIHLSADT